MLATPTRVYAERKSLEESEKRAAVENVRRELDRAKAARDGINRGRGVNEFEIKGRTPGERCRDIKENYMQGMKNVIKPSRGPKSILRSSTAQPTTKAQGKRKIIRKPPASAGIIPRVVRALFDISSRYTMQGHDVKITFCFVQIYNEKVSDLLMPASANGTNNIGGKSLPIREDPNLGVFIPDATQVIATSASGVLAVLRTAGMHRAVRSTCQNSRSSRSHAILRFTVTRGTEDEGRPGMQKVRRGTLTFVDLAGSEVRGGRERKDGCAGAIKY